MGLKLYGAICLIMMVVLVSVAYAKWLTAFRVALLTFAVKYICDIPIENEPAPVPPGSVVERPEKSYTLYRKPGGPVKKATGSHRPLYIVEVHGGAFVGGNRNVHRKYVRSLVSVTGLPVVSVEYDLAPGRRFPQTVWQIDRIIEQACPESCDIVLFGDSAGATHCLYHLLYSGSKTFQSLLGRENVHKSDDRHVVGFVSVSGYLDTELDQLNDDTFKEVYSILVSQFMNLEEARFFNPVKFAGEIGDGVKLLLTDSAKNSFASAMTQMAWRTRNCTTVLYNNPRLVHNFHFLADSEESRHFFRFLCDWLGSLVSGDRLGKKNYEDQERCTETDARPY